MDVLILFVLSFGFIVSKPGPRIDLEYTDCSEKLKNNIVLIEKDLPQNFWQYDFVSKKYISVAEAGEKFYLVESEDKESLCLLDTEGQGPWDPPVTGLARHHKIACKQDCQPSSEGLLGECLIYSSDQGTWLSRRKCP